MITNINVKVLDRVSEFRARGKVTFSQFDSMHASRVHLEWEALCMIYSVMMEIFTLLIAGIKFAINRNLFGGYVQGYL